MLRSIRSYIVWEFVKKRKKKETNPIYLIINLQSIQTPNKGPKRMIISKWRFLITVLPARIT